MHFRTMVNMDRFAAVFRHGLDAALWDACSGSDHSPDNSADLFDLVESFIETDENQSREGEKGHHNSQQTDCCYSCDSDREDELRNLFVTRENDNDIDAKEAILVEAEQAVELVGGRSSSFKGFKRQLMARLRRKGIDAGLCKSKLEKHRSLPAGEHEYIDVHVDGSRYIVEIFLAREFEIARPTSQYISLLNTFPDVFVGDLEELKRVVRLMCSAMKESMKRRDMHVPPWRRKGYMQAKWFGSYKRTTNEAPTHTVPGSEDKETFPERSSVCLKALPGHCRGDFGRNAGPKIGNFTAGFGGKGLLL